MANYSSSGTSSGSGSGSGSGSSAKLSVFQNLKSSSNSSNKINNDNNNNNNERDLDHEQLLIIEQRRKKRRVSNRDSARRSRLRKQKHEDDLTSQVCHLNKEKNVLMTEINRTTQKYLVFEAENWVLRAQVNELSNRLHSLHEIISFLSLSNEMINYYSAADAYNNLQVTSDHFFTDNSNMNAMAAAVNMLHY